MKPSLQVRLSQHLALTPQLQQSIRLLQLSTLELHQEVEQMLEQNPFLETEEEAAPAFEQSLERPSADRRGRARARRGASEADSDAAATSRPASMRAEWAPPSATTGKTAPSAKTSTASAKRRRARPRRRGDDDFDPQERNASSQTLQDHLRAQLAGMRLSPEDRAALNVLIESLDGDGYLADTLEDIAAHLADDDDDSREALLERLQCALKWLQSLEPLGVGARDLPECLALQLRAKPRCEAQAIAIIVCKQHLDLLARRDLKKLMAATGADEELLKAAQALIVACEPKPGRPFTRCRGQHRRARRHRAEERPRLEGGAQPRRDAQAAHQRPVCAGHQGPAQRRRRADVGAACRRRAGS